MAQQTSWTWCIEVLTGWLNRTKRCYTVYDVYCFLVEHRPGEAVDYDYIARRLSQSSTPGTYYWVAFGPDHESARQYYEALRGRLSLAEVDGGELSLTN